MSNTPQKLVNELGGLLYRLRDPHWLRLDKDFRLPALERVDSLSPHSFQLREALRHSWYSIQKGIMSNENEH